MKIKKQRFAYMRLLAHIMTLVVLVGFFYPVFSRIGPARAEDAQARYDVLTAEDLDRKLADAQDDAQAEEILIEELKNQAEELNTQLLAINSEIETINGQIDAKQVEIQAAAGELEAAEMEQKDQYAQMKLRIQYMYENQDTGLLALLFEGRGLSEILSAAEYVSQITQYDRNRLEDYKTATAVVEEKQETLRDEQQSLEDLLAELQAKEQDTADLIAGIQENVAVCNERLASYNTQIADVAGRIAEREELASEIAESQSVEESIVESARESAAESIAESEAAESAAYEKAVQESIDASIAESVQASIEASEAAAVEEARRQASAAAEESAAAETNQSGTDVTGNVDETELKMLATICYLEAGNQCYEAQLAVANVVLNRMKSSAYPDTMLEVLYQEGQFAPAGNGTFALGLAMDIASDSCYAAAEDALNGVNNVGSCIGFKLASQAAAGEGIIIQDICFF